MIDYTYNTDNSKKLNFTKNKREIYNYDNSYNKTQLLSYINLITSDNDILSENDKEYIINLMVNLFQYKEINDCINCGKFQLTKELFYIDEILVTQLGLSILSKVFNDNYKNNMEKILSTEDINILKYIKKSEEILSKERFKLKKIRTLFINQQDSLNELLLKDKYDIIKINKLKNKSMFNYNLIHEQETLINKIMEKYSLSDLFNKLQFIKQLTKIKLTTFKDVFDIIDFNKISNIKLGDNIKIIVYDFFSKEFTEISEQRLTKKVIYHKLSFSNNEEEYKEKHGCFVSGLICDEIYGIAKNSKIELMDMNNDFIRDENNIENYFNDNFWYKVNAINNLEFYISAINFYNNNYKTIDNMLFMEKWNKFTGNIVNCSFGINIKSYCKDWKLFDKKDYHKNIFYIIEYLFEFLFLIKSGKIIVHAAGNESLVFSGCNLYIEKSICNDNYYRKNYIWVTNIMLDGIHIHFSSNQPGTNEYMYTRTISSPGSYVKSLHCFNDSDELIFNNNEYQNLEEIKNHFNLEEIDIIKRFNITNKNDKYFVTGTGTSFSSPIVSGIIALLKSNFPEKDLSIILDAILESAIPIIVENDTSRNNPILCKNIMAKDVYNHFSEEIVHLSRSIYGMGRISLLNAYNYLNSI
jgi:hypothetical protein